MEEFLYDIVNLERLISIIHVDCGYLLNSRINAGSIDLNYSCRIWPLRYIEDELN